MKLHQAPDRASSAVAEQGQWSALVDGELDDAALTELLASLDEPEDRDGAVACADWQSYQLIGEVLRSGTQAQPPADLAFVARLRQRMDSEQPLPQHATPVLAPVAAQPVVQPPRVTPVANDGLFRWKLVAGLASVAAVGLLGWQLIGVTQPQAGPVLAQLPQPQAAVALQAVAPEAEATMLRPAGLSAQMGDLLSAHRQISGPMLMRTVDVSGR